MQTQHRRKLERLQKLLNEMESLVMEMLGESSAISAPYKTTPNVDARAMVEKLKSVDRARAEGLLLDKSYRELGEIFVAAGGAKADRKKPKEWLVNQVLWRIFDFQRGHEAIRTRGEQEPQN